MSIIRYNPYLGMEKAARKFNHFINNFEPSFGIEYGSFSPRVDISEDEKKIYINAEIAGLSKDDIKVTVSEDSILSIKGSKKKDTNTKETEDGLIYHRIERSYGEFSRSFVLPDNVNKDSIAAKFEDGVLRLSFDKIAPTKPKEVEININ
ncbi:MAG TPA: Hsp20/alpha crystallin family protein [Candidatus Kapabacteria bacterium]|nr:Hsp20/alpha crystallin family protein [Candidatus Kapabacteria bacterium]